MKTNPENIPAGIFDWVMSCSFEELSPAQKAEVLQYLDEESYNEMHAAATGLAGGVKPIPAAGGKAQKKTALLEKFDAHHHTKKGFVVFMYRPVALWKAAAIVVLLLSGWVYLFATEKKENPDQLVARVDTVFVTKEIPAEPVKIHDTVYITKNTSAKNKKDTAFKSYTTNIQNGALPVNETNAGVLPVDALEDRSNQPKGNSMKDDTLLRRFSFVTM